MLGPSLHEYSCSKHAYDRPLYLYTSFNDWLVTGSYVAAAVASGADGLYMLSAVIVQRDMRQHWTCWGCQACRR